MLRPLTFGFAVMMAVILGLIAVVWMVMYVGLVWPVRMLLWPLRRRHARRAARPMVIA